jgi:hypothetical protein
MTTSPFSKTKFSDASSFLPTAFHHDRGKLIWTKSAYATFRGTPVTAETIEASFMCESAPAETIEASFMCESARLPPNMERMSKQDPITAHEKDYIKEYILAVATLDL